jgi:hypothetical protein
MPAGSLGIPARTWFTCEAGVTLPAIALHRFIEVARAQPQ